jgi:hypothetical protein
MLFQMKSFIIGFSIDPQSPQNLQPTIRQTTEGIIVGPAVGTDGVVISGCPGRDIESQARPLLNDMAEVTITGFAEQHIGMFATALGERTGACHRLQDGWRGISSAVIT